VLSGGVVLARLGVTIAPAADGDGGPVTDPVGDGTIASTGVDPLAIGTGGAMALLLLMAGVAFITLRHGRRTQH
jgi:hypothetical protein